MQVPRSGPSADSAGPQQGAAQAPSPAELLMAAALEQRARDIRANLSNLSSQQQQATVDAQHIPAIELGNTLAAGKGTDMAKFEREARPSQNIEDVRERQKGMEMLKAKMRASGG